MLKKLLKYDLVYIYRCLYILYGVAIFFSILTRIFLNIDGAMIWTIIGKICSGTLISMMISIVMNNVLRLWARFSTNFYSDESYLTHTLPVNKSTLYAVKIMSALITMISSFLVILLSIVIAYYTKEKYEIFINTFIYKNGNIWDVLMIVLILIIQMLCVTQVGYTGITLGNRRINLKIAFSFIYGFVTYAIAQAIMMVAILLKALFDKDLRNVMFLAKNNMEPMDDTIKSLLCYAGIVYLIIFAITWIVNNKLFSKGVNVD